MSGPAPPPPPRAATARRPRPPPASPSKVARRASAARKAARPRQAWEGVSEAEEVGTPATTRSGASAAEASQVSARGQKGSAMTTRGGYRLAAGDTREAATPAVTSPHTRGEGLLCAAGEAFQPPNLRVMDEPLRVAP